MPVLKENLETMQLDEIHLQSTRVRFRNIAVATDFSPNALKALRVGAAVARRFAAKIHLVHVAMPTAYAADLSIAPAALEQGLVAADEAMRELGDHPLLAGLKHRQVVREGAVVDELRKFVEEQPIDLMIVGTAGRKGVEKLFLGSEAESIVRHMPCPVMIAGPHVGMAPIQYRSIVLAASLGPTSVRAAQYAVSLAEEMDSHLTLLHVERDPKRYDESTRMETYRRLRNLLPVDSECWCRPKVRFELGDPATQILATAMQDNADLIVMSTHDDPIFADHAPWSVLANVVRDAKCPVLAVRGHFG